MQYRNIVEDIVFLPGSGRVDWRWRTLYNIVAIGYVGHGEDAMRAAAKLLRVKIETDRRIACSTQASSSQL